MLSCIGVRKVMTFVVEVFGFGSAKATGSG